MFENIKYNQILNLVKIVCQVKDHNLDFIKTKYLADSEYFDNVLNLLTKINLITCIDNKLYPNDFISKNFTQGEGGLNAFKRYLIDKLLNTYCVYSKESLEYLNNFAFINNSYEYNPPTNKRLKESAIRNLFIELDVVLYDSQNDKYKINPKYIDIYKKLDIDSRKCISLKILNLLLKKQEELGKKAEEAILEYERLSLKAYPNLIKSIEHTSQIDVQAGFDIKSWMIKGKSDKKLRRFIEVKAVSNNNYEFKWTRNEINSSKKNKDQYFLYLLPCSNNKFNISALKVIQNPYNEIFGNKQYWGNQIEEYSIWKIK